MNTFLKKNFWVVNLAGIALLAFVAAGVVSDFIAGKLFALPAARWTTPKEPADGLGGMGELGRVAQNEKAAEELSTHRRIFELDDPTAPVVETPTETPVETPKEEPKPTGELTESQLPINLMGTFVSAVPDFTYATLQIEGEQKIASVGNKYLEGKAEIVKIARGHIVLKEDAAYTYVRLWAEKTAQAPATPTGPTPVRPGRDGNPLAKPMPVGEAPGNPPATDAAVAEGSPSEGVTKTGPYDYTLDRKMLDKQLADTAKLQSEARVVPHYQDNQYGGFKLVGVRPGSLYRAIGIRSGDIVTAVNGNKIDSPTKALELFEQLKSSSNISVEIERRGQPKTLAYTIQ